MKSHSITNILYIFYINTCLILYNFFFNINKKLTFLLIILKKKKLASLALQNCKTNKTNTRMLLNIEQLTTGAQHYFKKVVKTLDYSAK